MKIKNIKISTALLLSVLVVSIFMLFFSASIAYKQFQSITVSERLVIHSHKVIQTVLELNSFVKDAETAQRGYLLTQDTAFLSPYKNAFNKAEQTFDYFKTLTIDNPQQQKEADSLQYWVNKRFEMLEAFIQKSAIEFPLSNSDKTILLSGRNVMNKIRILTSEIIDFETIKLKVREDAHVKNVDISPITFLYSTIFSLLIFVLSFFKIFKDIRNLKKLNNQLVINKEIFGHNESIANISSWCWNIEAQHLIFSENQFRMLGCEPHEFEPTFEKYLEFIHPDDRHILIEAQQHINKGLSLPAVYYRIFRKDGEKRYFKSLGKIIVDTYNKNILIGINADITEEYLNNKILEERLFDLEQSNKELLAFNHVASHDLQEPLRKIQTFISRINEKEIDGLTETGKNYFSRIRIAANRMQLLIDDLLAFSRTNKAENVFELTDLNVLLENSLQELAQSIEDKKATINTCQLPTLNVIPFQIQQLFTNLIGNALKYSKADVLPVITISSEMVEGKDIVKSSFSSNNRLNKISISDNGIGFEEQHADEIFVLFNRLHNDSEFTGTGIGLTICKKIAENHKGFITAEGIPNVGSRFTVFIPDAN